MKRIVVRGYKITSFMVLSVFLSFILPTIIETTNILRDLQATCENKAHNLSQNISAHLVINGRNIKYHGWQAPLNCEYNPHNYGAPDSWHGSGTR